MHVLVLVVALSGCTKNKQPVDDLRTKAEQGDAKAQYQLGTMYDDGQGVPKNDAEAAKWFLKAAEQGDAMAQSNLGLMYASGRGVTKDETEAVKWHLKAAAQGLANAEFGLGVMYANGQGVPENREEAKKWYHKAQEQNYAGVIEWFHSAAEKGDVQAQFCLGVVHFSGRGVPVDQNEALKWFLKAAEGRHAKAQYWLGCWFNRREGTSNNKTEAMKWFRRAAEQGDAGAQRELSLMYYNGKDVLKDKGEGLKWVRKAVAQGDDEAQGVLRWNYGVEEDVGQAEAVLKYRKAAEMVGDALSQRYLGFMYASGTGVTKDEAEAVKWYQKAAEQGDVRAQFNLGHMYDHGRGVTQDDAVTVKWYRKAAEQGDADAQHKLGLMYKEGRGVRQDEAEAVKWFRKAASDVVDRIPNHYAQAELGRMYARGQGVMQDNAEALKLLREAVKYGIEVAEFELGRMYANGQGVPRDVAKAVEWYEKAATGCLEALSTLGRMYADGQGVKKDEQMAAAYFRKPAEHDNVDAQFYLGYFYAKNYNDVEAAKWYRRAAEQNNAEAQNNLGIMYAQGKGVPKDEVEAYKWLLLAGALREAAKGNIEITESRLTPTQRAEGQRLAREFQARKAHREESPVSREAAEQSRPESSGSGFFITDDGYLITNQHVAGKGATVLVLTGSGTISAKVVKVDTANDLALLKVEGKFASLPVTSSRSVRLGSTAATVGFPNVGLQGFSPKLAKGEIASLAGVQDDARHFQISLPLQPGNSGGALVDEHGNVIGIVKGGLSQKAAIATTGTLAENVNYAVKSSYLLSFLESIPEVAAKLKEPITTDRKFEDVIKDVEQAAVLVLVY